MKATYLVLTLCLGLSVLNGQQYSVTSTLNGSNSVPMNSSEAEGYVTGTYDSDLEMITLSVAYNDLEGTLTAAHLHTGASGSTGGVIVNLAPSTGTSTGTITGTYSIPTSNEAALLAGNIYINLHSTVYGGGEIRGQLSLTPTGEVLVQVEANKGDVQVTDKSHGVILSSPNGTCFRIRVKDDGTLVTEVVACP